MASILVLPAMAQSAPVKPVKPGALAAKKEAAKPRQLAPNGRTQASGGNSWFDVTVRELGTFFGQGEAVGQFEFANPHDESIDPS